MNLDQAEIIALQALAYLTANEKYRDALMAQTGTDADSLRQLASDSSMLGAILDFLMEDERRLLDCCQHQDWPPNLPSKARHALPGATAGM